MEDLILRADNVSYAYEDSEGMAVRGVTLGFRVGEMTAVLGHNGSGKSTLAKLLNGLYIPTEGHVTVCGMDTQEDEHTWDIRRSAGMVFQNPDNQLVASIVRDDVAFGLENIGVPSAQMPARIETALRQVEMLPFIDRAPHTLSGGQKQRIAIARALASDPEVLLCDEATSALDPTTTDSILKLLQKINRERGITVIIITHQMSVIEQICHRVAILDAGQVAEVGDVEKVFANPQSKAGQRLVSPDMGLPYTPEDGPIARIAFGGNASEEPIIASLTMDLGIKVSIMGADTRNVDGKAFGTMLISLPEDPETKKAVMDYLNNHPGVSAEEVQ